MYFMFNYLNVCMIISSSNEIYLMEPRCLHEIQKNKKNIEIALPTECLNFRDIIKYFKNICN